MISTRSRLLSGAAFSLLLATGIAGASESGQGSLILAQAATDAPATSEATAATTPVAIAEKAVEDARTALRDAMATGGDVRGARRTLQAALKDLNEVRSTAGLAPVQEIAPEPETAQTPPAATAPAPPAETAPAETPSVAVPTTPPQELPTLALPEPSAPPDEVPPPPPPAEIPTFDLPDNPPVELETIPPPAPSGPPTTTELPAPPAAERPTLAVPEAQSLPTLPSVAIPQPVPPAPAAPPAPDTAVQEPPLPVPSPGEAEPKPDKPGFFKRLFGGGKDEKKTTEEAAAPSTALNPPATDKKAGPTLPIFKALPPLAGPKIVTVNPGDASAVEQADDKRVIMREGGKLTVKHDDNDRFRRKGEDVRVEEGNAGTTVTTVKRQDGTEVVTVRDTRGDILQRYRKQPKGQIDILIGDRDRDGKPRQGGKGTGPRPAGKDFDFYKSLPKLVVPIPQGQYIVGSQGASRAQIQEALVAPPIEAIERPYSLDEIRGSERLRAKLRRIDVDTVNFEFGAATIAEDQVPNLQAIGNALAAIVADDPSEVFLIEGHTDAVGSDLANLSLSDQRAESIAEILTYYFDIPPENLVTQGYGEQYLKVLTSGPERQNRRAGVRRITPLLAGQM